MVLLVPCLGLLLQQCSRVTTSSSTVRCFALQAVQVMIASSSSVGSHVEAFTAVTGSRYTAISYACSAVHIMF
jgi:hypothetical protein